MSDFFWLCYLTQLLINYMTRDNLSQIVNTSSVNTSNTYASTWEVLKRKIKQDAAYLKQY